MSPLDPATLGTDSPRTLDGRRYPDHLRAYHAYDARLLPLVAQLEPATFDAVSAAIDDPKLRAALPRWLASAVWRGLVERRDSSIHGPRSYAVGPQGHLHLTHAA